MEQNLEIVPNVDWDSVYDQCEFHLRREKMIYSVKVLDTMAIYLL